MINHLINDIVRLIDSYKEINDNEKSFYKRLLLPFLKLRIYKYIKNVMKKLQYDPSSTIITFDMLWELCTVMIPYIDVSDILKVTIYPMNVVLEIFSHNEYNIRIDLDLNAHIWNIKVIVTTKDNLQEIRKDYHNTIGGVNQYSYVSYPLLNNVIISTMITCIDKYYHTI